MYINQNTDKSGATFVKFAGQIEDPQLAEIAIKAFFNPRRDKTSDGQIKTAEDVIVNTVYFEGQKDTLPKDEAERMATKLAALQTLYNVEGNFSMRKCAEKKETTKTDVHGEMQKISETLIVHHGNGKTYGECQKLANRYCKLASEAGIEIPSSILLYKLDKLEARPDIKDAVLMHKFACIRQGKNGGVYQKLANALDKSFVDMPGLRKLATIIDDLDNKLGVRMSKSGRNLPNGLETVFRIKKEAEIEQKESSGDNVDKATIVARFGDDALNVVEKDDGTLDKDRVNKLVQMFGGNGNEGSNSRVVTS